MSAFIATRLSIVSSSVSPLDVDDAPMLRLMTSADSRFAAISKVVRVRVELSKNRLNTALPRRSGTFLTSRSPIEANGSAVSRIDTIVVGRQAFERQQVDEAPVGAELGVPRAVHGLSAGSTESTKCPPSDFDSTIESARAQATRAPTYVGSIGSSRPPRSTSTASSIAFGRP